MLSGQLNQEGWDGGTRNAYIILADNSWDHFEDIRTDEKITFKCILKKWVEYLSWLGIRLSVDFCEQSHEPPVIIMIGNILISLKLSPVERDYWKKLLMPVITHAHLTSRLRKPIDPLYFCMLHTNMFIFATSYH
jgi:hypothetical protein